MNFRSAYIFLKSHKLPIVVATTSLVIIIPIVTTTILANKYNIAFSAGSSAVQPILSEIGTYYTNNVDKYFDLNVDSGGSSTGIETVANGYTQMGNTSRSPKESEAGVPTIDGTPAIDGTFSKQWKDLNLKTITLCWDGISIIYKPSSKDSLILDINDSNINKIYEAFTGWYSHDKPILLSDITLGAGDKEITAFSRTGGSQKSGTADAFANDSHLTSSTPLNPQAKKALKDGSYNQSKYLVSTNEANIQTWNQISSSGEIGSMTYLSTGFVLNNILEIHDKGYEIATYKGQKLTYDKLASGSNGYNWVRPLNTIISVDTKDFIKDFIYWIISNSYQANDPTKLEDSKITDFKNFYKKIGVKYLSTVQIDSMCNKTKPTTEFSQKILQPNDFWLSDYDLIIQNKKPGYGAIFNSGIKDE